MPAGPATLALRSGAALLPTVVYSGPGLYHTAVISPPLDTTRQASLRKDVARVTQEIAGCFEHFVRRAPGQWHLFQPNWPSERSASVPGPSGAPAGGD
jgi:lauroyl/myristoyl acyltransferase